MEISAPNKQHANKMEDKEKIEIIYHTRSKLFTNKSPKPKGLLNIVLKVKKIYITR